MKCGLLVTNIQLHVHAQAVWFVIQFWGRVSAVPVFPAAACCFPICIMFPHLFWGKYCIIFRWEGTCGREMLPKKIYIRVIFIAFSLMWSFITADNSLTVSFIMFPQWKWMKCKLESDPHSSAEKVIWIWLLKHLLDYDGVAKMVQEYKGIQVGVKTKLQFGIQHFKSDGKGSKKSN